MLKTHARQPGRPLGYVPGPGKSEAEGATHTMHLCHAGTASVQYALPAEMRVPLLSC